MTRRKAWVAWSSGKDSAWALWVARQNPDLEIAGLLTTITEAFARVTMHGVREELVQAQTAAAGLPLQRVFIPTPCSNEQYEAVFEEVLARAKGQGITSVIFGDLFLADLRAYRARQLARVAMEALFPLWLRDTASLAREMIRGGLRAHVTCIDPRKMPRELCGAAYDEAFLRRLPPGVDPCGENGEFHTFACDGPMFSHPIPARVGETVERDGFLFTDLLPNWDEPHSPEEQEASGSSV